MLGATQFASALAAFSAQSPSTYRGTTLEHEVGRHNNKIVEDQKLLDPLKRPCASEAERVARRKALRARSVVKARVKRVAARVERVKIIGAPETHYRADLRIILT